MKHSGFSSDVVTEIKRAVSIPVITVGRFTEPHYGELLIRQGRADLIAFGRQSIADPNLPNRIRRGEYDRIQPCIGCLQGCVPNLLAGKPITCLVNPAVGKEGTANCLTSCPKKIMVVGGGPAGLMAAKSCAEKGHTVHLYEGSAKVGGQLLPASVPPGKGTISAVIQAYRLLCEDSGVTFHYNTTVTAEQIACEAPDVLVLATGGKPSRPPIPGLESSGCFDSVTVLNGNASCGKKVLILGGGMVGCETAAFLGERGHTVTILERQSVVGGDMGAEHRLELQALFHQYSIKEITNATVLSCLKDGVQYEKNGIPQQLDGFDSIVLALGAKRWNPLEDTAKDMGIPYVVIGDASAPRRALDATREGYDFAETMSSYK
jgi:NADPH-dependent 2,4-dienoyl-CoA reductase/sulfur reductase-like enzyme